MASIEAYMGLRVWDQLSDKFDHDQLAQNWAKVGAHDHTSGKGTQIPTGGIADQAVTNAKIADATIGSAKLSAEALSTIATATSLPPGLIVPYSGVVVPAGWLLCDGSAVSRSTYAALWDAYRNGGTTSPYGNGNGTSTFNLPDLRGRVPVGVDGVANRLSANDFLGASGGEEKHTLTVGEMPSHSHSLPTSGVTSPTMPSDATRKMMEDFRQGTGFSYLTSSYGGDGPHNNMQPYQIFNYIVKF